MIVVVRMSRTVVILLLAGAAAVVAAVLMRSSGDPDSVERTRIDTRKEYEPPRRARASKPQEIGATAPEPLETKLPNTDGLPPRLQEARERLADRTQRAEDRLEAALNDASSEDERRGIREKLESLRTSSERADEEIRRAAESIGQN